MKGYADFEMDEYTKLAEKYMPKNISILLIGESPPFTPNGKLKKYFYNDENTQGDILLRTVAYAIFNEKYGKGNGKQYNKEVKKNILEKLRENGIFLIDAVDYPINKNKDGKIPYAKRREIIASKYPDLKEKLLKLPLKPNTKVFLVHNNIVNSIKERLQSNFSQIIIPVGFPRYHHDQKFVDKIRGKY